MDKGLTRLLKGRLRIVAVMVMCLSIVALPAMAFGAGVGSPTGTLASSPRIAGWSGTSATPLNASNASITMDGNPIRTFIAAPSTVGGTWTSTQTLVNGNWVIRWTWAPTTSSATNYTVYCYPPAGSHSFVATINGETTAWSYTVNTALAPSSIGAVTPGVGSTVSNTPDFTVAWSAQNGVDWMELYLNGNLYFSAVAPDDISGNSGVKTFLWGTYTPLAPGTYTARVDLYDNPYSGNLGASKTWTFNVSAPSANLHKAPINEQSSACVACHAGGDLTAIHGGKCNDCHGLLPAEEFEAAAAAGNSCNACHIGPYAAHSFTNGTTSYPSDAYVAAGGHNTTTFGVIGGLTKWDGSEGVIIKDSAGNTITQEWPRPTASVFWSDSNKGSLSPTDAPEVAMANRGFASGAEGAAALRTDMDWDSVVTCQDCHTNLDSSMGPQGANAGQVGLDPNFPDDWTKAEITSFDPTGMRKIDTVRDTPNPYYPKLGSNVYMPMEVINGTLAGSAVETTQKPVFGAGMGANPATVTVYPGGFYGLTNVPSNGYSMGDSTGRFICQKCHKLTNSFQGLGIEGNGRGARDNNLNYMGMSNEAHMEHHNDMVTGQGNCVSCHIAIPHGWKRPRLLVYESDPAPYKVQYVWPEYRSTDQAVLRNMAPTNLYSAGNWGFLSNPTATALSRYQDTTAINAFTGGVNSTHLEKLDASTNALKELAVGPAEEFEGYDAQNTAAIAPYWPAGIGSVDWEGWDMAAEGVEWHGNTDAGAARINLTVWDAATNSQVVEVDGEAPIQNQCTACTSASAGTHAPQVVDGVRVNNTNEGVNPALPYWK